MPGGIPSPRRDNGEGGGEIRRFTLQGIHGYGAPDIRARRGDAGPEIVYNSGGCSGLDPRLKPRRGRSGKAGGSLDAQRSRSILSLPRFLHSGGLIPLQRRVRPLHPQLQDAPAEKLRPFHPRGLRPAEDHLQAAKRGAVEPGKSGEPPFHPAFRGGKGERTGRRTSYSRNFAYRLIRPPAGGLERARVPAAIRPGRSLQAGLPAGG